MRLFWRTQRRSKPTDHETAHIYAVEILGFSKLRQSALQRMILQPTESNKREVKLLDEQLAIMLKTMQKLTKKGLERDNE